MAEDPSLHPVEEEGMKRPGYGTKGTAISLIANVYELRLLVNPAQVLCHHYDIVIVDLGRKTPGPLNHIVARRVFGEMHKRGMFGEGVLPAYDGGRNFYTPEVIPDTSLHPDEIEVMSDKLPRRLEPFSFEINHTISFSLQDLRPLIFGERPAASSRVLQALNIVLKHPLAQRYPHTKRAIFPGWASSSFLNGGVELKKGFIAQLRPAPKRLLINIDITSAAFIHTPESARLIDVVLKLLGSSQFRHPDSLANMHDQQKVEINKRLRRATIDVIKYNGDPGITRHYLQLTPKAANQTFFKNDDGVTVSVADYFRSKLKCELRFPGLPCVAVNRKVSFPIEFCYLRPNQRWRLKLTKIQQQKALEIQTSRPHDRFRQITDARGRFEDTIETVKQYQMKLDKDPLKIKGRKLEPPTVHYAASTVRADPNGAWNLKGGHRFAVGGGIPSWAVLNLSGRPEKPIETFVRSLAEKLESLGVTITMKVAPPILTAQPTYDIARMKEYMDKCGVEAFNRFGVGPTIMLVITKGKDDNPLYRTIKVAGDELGHLKFTTQCFVSTFLDKSNDQYFTNLAKKINPKVKGVNHQVRELPITGKLPTIIFGADVTHSGASTFKKPGIATVVASMERFSTRFIPTARAQPLLEPLSEGRPARSQEPIVELEAMVYDMLMAWNKTWPALGAPHQAIFYRDGVSDGEYGAVLVSEVASIDAAFQRFLAKVYQDRQTNPVKNARPLPDSIALTYIICGKRHHIRFTTEDPNAADRSGNVPSGTVVDTEIIHPTLFDFYSVTHGGLKGTSRPCHYTVLRDDSNFSADDIQGLTNGLCHNFQRASRPVSLVTPAYYAHIFGERARKWVPIDMDDASSVGGQSVVQTDAERHADLAAFDHEIGIKLQQTELLRDRMWWL